MVAFLAVFLAFGVIGLEAWPMTAWRLFSVRRHQTVSELQAFTVDGDGDEHKIEFIDLPMGSRHADRLLSELGGMSQEERDEFCEALAPQAAEVRIYRVRERVPTSAGAEPEVISRELKWTCAA